MKTPMKILIVLAVAAAATGAVVLKNNKGSAVSVKPGGAATNLAAASAVNAKLPRLLDLGAGKCVPCKLMAPILETLKKDYAGRMHVEFIDVWENTEAAKQYGVEAI